MELKAFLEFADLFFPKSSFRLQTAHEWGRQMAPEPAHNAVYFQPSDVRTKRKHDTRLTQTLERDQSKLLPYFFMQNIHYQ